MKKYGMVGFAILLATLVGCSKPAPSGPEYGGKHLSEWVEALKDPNVDTRREAARALALMGKEGTDAKGSLATLQDVVRDEKDERARGWSAIALYYFGSHLPMPVVPMVKPTLEETVQATDDAQLRAEATELLEKFKSRPSGPPTGPPGRGGPGPKQEPDKSKEEKEQSEKPKEAEKSP